MLLFNLIYPVFQLGFPAFQGELMDGGRCCWNMHPSKSGHMFGPFNIVFKVSPWFCPTPTHLMMNVQQVRWIYVYIYIYMCVCMDTYMHACIHTYITYIPLHYITLHCTALHWIKLHYIELHYITTLHYIPHRQTDIHTYIHTFLHTYMYIYIYTHWSHHTTGEPFD